MLCLLFPSPGMCHHDVLPEALVVFDIAVRFADVLGQWVLIGHSLTMSAAISRVSDKGRVVGGEPREVRVNVDRSPHCRCR
jgi:hypothetical protein